MATFLLEVGTEELPASFLQEALEQWRSRLILQHLDLKVEQSRLNDQHSRMNLDHSNVNDQD